MHKFFKGDMRLGILSFVMLATVFVFAAASDSSAEISDNSDSRIKTMVYNDNEVYTVLTRNGFTTAIELSRKEKIQTISLGDSVGWTITPSNNRIFIKPLLRNSITNLSVITDKHTYQFELIVSSERVRNVTHAYVVKFFYPSESSRGNASQLPPQQSDASIYTAPQIPSAPVPSAFSAPQPSVAPAIPVAPSRSAGVSELPSLGSIGIQAYNFNYTLTGPENSAPKKIFDDGKSTYFEFASSQNSAPQLFYVSPTGTEMPLSVRKNGNKYIVDKIASKFVIRRGAASEQICVFNESLLSGA